MTQPNTKPHTKVHVSVAYHHKTSDIWADLRQRGMLVEVWRLAVERYAAKRNDTLALRPLDRQSIVTDRDAAGADADLITLFKALRYPLRRYPNRWEVTIRNLSKKHGFWSRDRSPITSGSGLHKIEEIREKKEEKREKREDEYKEPETPAPQAPASPATPASKSNGKSRRILIPKPDLFPGDSMDRLRAWGDKHGFGQRVLNAGLEVFREWVPVKPPYLRPIETWEGAFKKITRDGVADDKIKLTGDAAKPKGLAYAEWTGHGDEVAR